MSFALKVTYKDRPKDRPEGRIIDITILHCRMTYAQQDKLRNYIANGIYKNIRWGSDYTRQWIGFELHSPSESVNRLILYLTTENKDWSRKKIVENVQKRYPNVSEKGIKDRIRELDKQGWFI